MGRLLALALFVVSMGACSRDSSPAGPNANGQSWAVDPIVMLTAGAPDNRGPSTAADGSRVVIVWAATSGETTNIHAAVSGDGGVTFGAPVRVNHIAGDARVNGEQPPVVSISGQQVVVAWQSRRSGTPEVRLARSQDGGKTFSAAETIHPAGLKGVRGWSSIALDATGGAHVSWLDTRLGGAPAQAEGPANPAPAGHVHQGAMRQDVYHAVVPADGAPRETLVTTDVCFCCKTGTAIGPDGSLYVAFRHIFPGSLRDMAVARSTDGGHTFAPPVRVHQDGWELTGCPEDGPSIGVDRDGVLHIAWPTITDAAAERKGVFYSFSTDGGRTFAPRLKLDDDAGVRHAQHPRLTIAADGVVVIWDESTEQGPRIRTRMVRRSANADGGVPELLAPVTLSEAGSVTYPSIAATGSAFLAAWVSITDGGSVIHARRLSRTGR